MTPALIAAQLGEALFKFGASSQSKMWNGPTNVHLAAEDRHVNTIPSATTRVDKGIKSIHFARQAIN
jgi:hypothetical protein